MKKSLILFWALLALLISASRSKAQNPDCYDIQCPSKIVAACESAFGTRVWFSVTASNRCSATAPPTITYSVAPGSLFAPGSNIVCATIQIPGLPPRQCCFPVVVDNCCPTNCIDVICPKDIIVSCQQTAAGPGAFVNLPRPQATNYCGDHNLPTDLQWRCIPAPQPGQAVFFPPGTNTVVWCLTDGKGGEICCCFKVIVTGCPTTHQECRPEIVCPTNIQVQCEGTNGAIVFFPTPRVFDPCGLVVATNFTRLSGTLFPNGKTTVVWCITWVDPATGQQHVECCCFDVIVRCCKDECQTTLRCPTNVVVDCPGPNGVVLHYSAFGTN